MYLLCLHHRAFFTSFLASQQGCSADCILHGRRRGWSCLMRWGMSENNARTTPWRFRKTGRGSPCRIEEEPCEDSSHLPAMRLGERAVLAGLEGGMSVSVQGLWLCRRIRHRGVGFIGYSLFVATTLGLESPGHHGWCSDIMLLKFSIILFIQMQAAISRKN